MTTNLVAVFLNCITVIGLFTVARACMSTGGGDGGEVTPETCPVMGGQALMFQQNDNEFQPEVWGAVPAAGVCEACATGSDNYYTSTTSATPTPTLMEAAGSLNSNNCPELCACSADGTCFTWTGLTPDVTLTFWPFCDVTCAVYGVLTSTSDAAGLAAVGGGNTFTAGSQLTVVNNQVVYQPVTNPVYPQITSVGCGGCDNNPKTCLNA